MREPVLVASIDGVGTKLKVALALNKHDTVGADLVNHCATTSPSRCSPLFLDYIGCGKLEPRVSTIITGLFARLPISGVCSSRRRDGADARMYRNGEYDLAGCIIGVVDRGIIIDRQEIRASMAET